MRVLLVLACLLPPSPSFATDEVVFDRRVAGNRVRDLGVVVDVQAIRSSSLVDRLKAFAISHRHFDVARLTLATDVTTVLEGIGVEESLTWCDTEPAGPRVEDFVQVYSIRGAAVARLMINGSLRSIRLIGNTDPFELEAAGVKARLGSFLAREISRASERYSMRLFVIPERLPTVEVGALMAAQFKRSLGLTGGLAVFRVDGCFACENGPRRNYLAEIPREYSKDTTDATAYLLCKLDGAPTCELRARARDNAELMRDYERRKTEFMKENERLKRQPVPLK